MSESYSSGDNRNKLLPSMIIEGFICPECQQDMSTIELLQAHFELVHLTKSNKSNNFSLNSNGASLNGQDSNELSLNSNRSAFSSVLAKAKTFISSSFDQSSSTNPFLENGESDIVNGSTQSQTFNNGIANNNSNNNNNNTNISNGSSTNNQSINPNSSSSNLSSSGSSSNLSNVSNSFLKKYFSSNQSDGYFNSHTAYFKKMRDNTIGRYVVQTNKLLITLDKLISIDLNLFSDETKRDLHYKSLVQWVQDKDVQLCPNCAKSFNLINRKHHCRLCGAIMCNKCSEFISFTLAKQLTDPDSFIKSLSNNSSQNEFRLKRSDSITSVNSYFFKSNSLTSTNNNSTDDQSFSTETNSKNKKIFDLDQIYLRLCMDCSHLLEKKYKFIRDKMTKPLFTNLYDELYSCITESKRLYPIYTKMAESLNTGESIYQLSNAEEMRHKLIKLFQQIETLSGQMLKYGIEPEENEKKTSDSKETTTDALSSQKKISSDQLKLQRNIRFYAINYLKDHSFNLSQLPTGEVYAKLKAQRQVYLLEEMKRTELEQLKQKQKINEEVAKRQRKLQKQNATISSSSSSSSALHKLNDAEKKKFSISIDNSNGWIPSIKPTSLLENSDNEEINEQSNEDDEIDDELKSVTSKKSVSDQDKALRIQIQLVEGYLQDAIKHNKHEEATILRQNLNELLNTLVNK